MLNVTYYVMKNIKFLDQTVTWQDCIFTLRTETTSVHMFRDWKTLLLEN